MREREGLPEGRADDDNKAAFDPFGTAAEPASASEPPVTYQRWATSITTRDPSPGPERTNTRNGSRALLGEPDLGRLLRVHIGPGGLRVACHPTGTRVNGPGRHPTPPPARRRAP
jgi:hypothetical protein